MIRHGGRDRWRTLSRIDIDFSAGGLAFAARGLDQTLLRGVRGRFSPHRFEGEFSGLGAAAEVARFAPDRVCLLSRGLDPLLERKSPRRRFSSLARQFKWDRGDLVYFAAYAMWNYVCFPFCLSLPGVELRGLSPWRERGRRLDVAFPEGFPTHSRSQQFYFDAELRLVLHAYRADVIGPYARAIHRCSDYRTSDGFGLSRRRRVTPRVLSDVALVGPTLVWIEIERAHYVQRANSESIETSTPEERK